MKWQFYTVPALSGMDWSLDFITNTRYNIARMTLRVLLVVLVYCDVDYLPSCCCDFYRQHGNRVHKTLSRTYVLPHSQRRDRQRWALCLLILGPGHVPAV